MKVKRRSLWNLTWLLGKTTWTEEKWSDPLEGDRKRLWRTSTSTSGDVNAGVGEPRLRTSTSRQGKKPVKGVRVEIPVTEGISSGWGRLPSRP